MQRFKILHHNGVEISDDDSIYTLIQGCPVLDELSMQNCVGEHLGGVNISAPVLTKLFIKPLACYYGCMHETVLDCPALLYLKLEDSVYLIEGYIVKNLSYLIKVDINIGGLFCMEEREIISENVTDLLMGISLVRCLRLQGELIAVCFVIFSSCMIYIVV